MAIVQTNNRLVTGLSGSIGNLVFRNLRGKVVLSEKTSAPAKQSEQQQENCFKFKCASSYAKSAMLSAEKKQYYRQKATDLKLPNAYVAAIMDYMRKGEVTGIDTRHYRGRAGDLIRVKIEKKDFAVHQAKAALYTTEGKLIESGTAIKTSEFVFEYKVKTNVPYYMPVILRITLCDHIMNMTIKDVRLAL
jgi:hypothetical protein